MKPAPEAGSVRSDTSQDGCTVRTTTPDDLSIILYHRRRMFEDMGFEAGSIDAALETSRVLIQRGMQSGRYRGWLVEDRGGKVVAGGGINVQEFPPHPLDPALERAWVVNMFTEPGYRRRGLARLLMKTMFEWCRSRGMKSLCLHASDEGRPLYQSLGFRPTNEMRLQLSAGGSGAKENP